MRKSHYITEKYSLFCKQINRKLLSWLVHHAENDIEVNVALYGITNGMFQLTVVAISIFVFSKTKKPPHSISIIAVLMLLKARIGQFHSKTRLGCAAISIGCFYLASEWMLILERQINNSGSMILMCFAMIFILGYRYQDLLLEATLALLSFLFLVIRLPISLLCSCMMIHGVLEEFGKFRTAMSKVENCTLKH